MIRQKKSIFLAIGFYLFLSVLLPAIWFRDGLMKAGGEEGLPLYSPERTFRLFRFTWQEISTGVNLPTYVSRAPFSLIASLFIGRFGFSSALFQAILFGFLLFSSACSMFYLSFILAKDLKEGALISFLAGLFYLLNPFVIINVWRRFLYPFFFFLPLLPLTLALFVHGLLKKDIKFVFFISTASFIFSCAFGAPAFVITFWIPIGFYLLSVLVINRKQNPNLVFALKFFFTTLLFWILTNLWWALSLFVARGSVFPTMTMEYNLASLRGASTFFTLKFVPRMLSSYFLFDHEFWGPGYKTAFFQLLSWIAPLIAGLTFVKKRKNPAVCFFGLLAILTIFLAKGTSPPFGEVFAWLFTRSIIFNLLRNPFEKLGLILAVSYSFLFGVGLASFYSWAKEQPQRIGVAAKLLVCLICFLTMGLYLWPVWTGQLFGTIDTKVTVEIPEYYQEANQWLNNQGEDFRILSLPTRFGEGVIYDWPSGYYGGGEPSHFIFDLPVVARDVPAFPEFFQVLLKNLYSHQLWKMMSLFSAKYVLINKDLVYQELAFDSPENIKKILDSIVKPSLFSPENKQLTKVCGAVLYRGSLSVGRFELPVCYISKEKQDWSKKTFLRIRVKSDKQALFEVDLIDKEGDRFRWDGQVDKEYILEAGQWKSFVIPLRVPTEGSEKFNYKEVQMVSIIIHRASGVDPTGDLEGVPVFDSAKIEVEDIYIDEGIPQKTENIHFERSFGNLDFYKLEEKYFVPRIYATNQVLLAKDTLSMFEEIEEDSFFPGQAVFFLESQGEINQFTKLSLPKQETVYQPKIDFKKINPTRYKIKVKDVTQPFFLVFNETYHPSWELFFEGKKVKHFLVNGYANGYYINETGDLDFKLGFLPQRFLRQGGLISTFSILFLGGLIVYGGFKKRKTAKSK